MTPPMPSPSIWPSLPSNFAEDLAPGPRIAVCFDVLEERPERPYIRAIRSARISEEKSGSVFR